MLNQLLAILRTAIHPAKGTWSVARLAEEFGPVDPRHCQVGAYHLERWSMLIECRMIQGHGEEGQDVMKAVSSLLLGCCNASTPRQKILTIPNIRDGL